MNKINPKKLLNSKWTAVTPQNKEKHFIVSDIKFDEDDSVIECQIEPVMSKIAKPINWQELRDSQYWIQGWK